MGRTKKTGRVARLGARYGVTLRKRLLEIEAQAKGKHVCPSCGVKAVTRTSVGIWTCRRCSYTFTGGAYTPLTKVGETVKRRHAPS